ncbi:MAG: transcriptional regulator [Thermoprotei archaeon]|nr:MAG: transcriptional regulator [Thermoprotei archaeon]
MDEKDLYIIKRLIENAKISKTALAKELNLSETAIRKRLKRLERDEIILGYRAIINYKKTGLYYAIIGLNIEIEKLPTILNELEKIKEIKLIHLTSGDHDILLETITEKIDDLTKIYNTLQKIEGITKIYPSIINLTIKPQTTIKTSKNTNTR